MGMPFLWSFIFPKHHSWRPPGVCGEKRGEKVREKEGGGKIKWDKGVFSKCENIHLCFKWYWEAHILWVAVRVSVPRSSIPVLCLSLMILHQVCPECALGMHGTDGMKWARLTAAIWWAELLSSQTVVSWGLGEALRISVGTICILKAWLSTRVEAVSLSYSSLKARKGNFILKIHLI